MDKLNVGDKVEVKTYNTTTSAKVNGFTETLDNELTRLCK